MGAGNWLQSSHVRIVRLVGAGPAHCVYSFSSLASTMIVRTQLWCLLVFCLHTHFAGFLYPSSVWVGDSPVLQYLLKCKLEKGIRKLQILADLPVTGVIDDEVLKMVEKHL